jgi:hypothetical protein
MPGRLDEARPAFRDFGLVACHRAALSREPGKTVPS